MTLPTLDLEEALETAMAAYLDNAGYANQTTSTEARAFAAACTQLIILMPSLQRQAGRFEIQFNTRILPLERDAALVYANLIDSQGVRGFDFTNFRD